MRVIKNPPGTQWPALTRRPQLPSDVLDSQVSQILSAVQKNGDEAIREFTLRFDGVDVTHVELDSNELNSAKDQVSEKLQDAICMAAKNIETFHRQQVRPSVKIETMPGVWCWRKSVPIDKVGIYIPGGTAPLFSTVLMLGIPARLAGCSKVVLCSPPDKNGKINPAILFAASLCGIKEIFKVGGAQAIAAMTYGTKTIPRVDKIFGPGNQYVTRAKELVSISGTSIDLPAGPSEVLVIGDAHSNPSFIAADLLSQAEHGRDSQVVLLSTDEDLIEQVIQQLALQIEKLPRKNLAAQSIANSFAIWFPNLSTAIGFSNAYAPEHLIIQTSKPESIAEEIKNAGSVFLGPWSPESVGDYASGTNHTLPTQGHAKSYSGVSLESFEKTITFQQLDQSGLRQIGPAVETMAEAEGLEGHRLSVNIRLKAL